MTGNLPSLLDNVCFGLSTELGQQAFLWAQENRDPSAMKYRAEAYAHEVEDLVSFTIPLIRMGFAGHTVLGHRFDAEERIEDLQHFLLTRHANQFWGANVTLPWGRTA